MIGRQAAQTIRRHLAATTRPARTALVTGTLADAARSRSALVAENALLRHQLVVLRRSVKRPRCTPADRALLVLLASRVRAWRRALLIVQPETLLRWHRAGLPLALAAEIAARGPSRPPLAAETVALIRRAGGGEPPLGRRAHPRRAAQARHPRGQAHDPALPARRPARRGRGGQTWATFLRNHAHEIWACDFLPVTDLALPAAVRLLRRRARRRAGWSMSASTRHPTDAWVAQQLREATPFDQRPRYLIRDNDGKYGVRLNVAC